MFLLKLFFGDHGHPARVVEHVERFRDQAAARLAALQAIERQGPQERTRGELPWMTLRQGLAASAAHLRWAEEILPKLTARSAQPLNNAQTPASQR